MKYDVMLDLETFGLGPTAAIIQIGAVEFDPFSTAAHGDERRFRADVMLQSSLGHGMTVDAGTIDFWRQQGLEKLKQHDALTLRNALLAFKRWWNLGQSPESANVWANGLAFDVPIMDYGFKAIGEAAPWHYRNTRDQRTAKAFALFKGMPEETRKEPVHEALQDAEAQAAQVQQYMRWISK